MGENRKEQCRKAASGGFLAACIIFISFCLRAPITVVGPQVSSITEELKMSSSLMGLVTMLPPLSFGFFSLLVGRMGKRLGIPKTILIALTGILAGLVIRCADGVVGLFAGTILMGMGIAIGNVMIPSMIRKWFPDRVSQMTSVYTTSMGTFAAIGAGTSIPISVGLGWGWRGALGIWSVTAALALALWLVQMKKGQPGEEDRREPAAAAEIGANRNAGDPKGDAARHIEASGRFGDGRRSVWTSRTAWYITLFMGLQSLLFYSTTSWMPAIVQDHGVTMEGASLLALSFQATGIIANMAASAVYSRTKRQEVLGFGIGVVFLIGISGMLFSGEQFALMAVLLVAAGLASGGSLSWILTSIGTMGRDAVETADLSGMAQSVGYLLAAVGPAASGVLYDATGSWTVTICFYLAAAAGLAFFGILVGSRKSLFPEER